MSTVLRWVSHRRIWLLVLAVAIGLIVIPTFPGRANHDTDQMVRDMDVGVYSDWWSPLLMMAWRPLYEVGLGLGFIQASQVAVFVIAVGSLLRPLFVRRVSAGIATLAVCVFPTTYAMLINVIRDTWFTVAIVASVAVVFRTRRPQPIHGALLAMGLGAVVASRQNGALVVAAIACAAALHWNEASVGQSRVQRTIAGVAAGALFGFLYFAGAQALLAVTDVESTGPETATFYVDLDEMSTRVGRMLVPDVYIIDTLTLDDLAEHRNYLADGVKPMVQLRLSPEDRDPAAEAWRAAVMEYPYVYLQSRWQMFTRQIGWSGAPAEAYYATVGTSREFGPRSERLSNLSTAYLSMFDDGDKTRGGFLHRPWLYLAIAAVAAMRFGRRWPLLWCVPAVQLSILLGLFVLSPISKVRLVYPVFVLGLIAAMYAISGSRPERDHDKVRSTRLV